MSLDRPDVETLEIGNLEYDVASIGSAEEFASEGTKLAFYIIFFWLPERA
jgi:hypothetical protein